MAWMTEESPAALSVGSAPPALRIDGLQLTTDILRLNECTSCEQIHDALAAICATLGFDGFLFGGRYQTGGTRYVEQIVSNYSPSWRARYQDPDFIHADPTFDHARTSISPLVWSDRIYASAAQRAYQQEALRHGLAEGATFPVHGRNGDVARLNLSLTRADAPARAHVRAMLMWGALLATMTHEATGRVVRQRGHPAPPALTRREAEVLDWIAAGKSNWEISRLVAITEHGVSHHVRNILLKFEVGCRHQAVAKAIAFGVLRNRV
jgi:LuxR family quorum-sensing transcriptional regulator LasR